MAHWTLDDIAWEQFDPSKVDPEILKIIKAASLVEHNGYDYARYLQEVFHDDPEFRDAAWGWAEEEVQHGRALAKWAQMADPSFDFDAAFARFTAEIKLPEGIDASVRGSRVGELVSRCMVEIGTSSYYSALAAAVDEPVLADICERIHQDEIRHYGLFRRHMERWQEFENVGFWERLRIAISRARETEDDELAFAYYAANHADDGPYDRETYMRAYMRRAYAVYGASQVEKGVVLFFRAVGIRPYRRLSEWIGRGGHRFIRYRANRLEAQGA